jgi:hypothetical protein
MVYLDCITHFGDSITDHNARKILKGGMIGMLCVIKKLRQSVYRRVLHVHAY